MDVLQDEVESLEAILMDDVTIKRNPESGNPEIIETTIFPIVGDDAEEQYVCVTLQVFPSLEYPDKSPEFKLVKPRGLDDSRLNTINSACVCKLQESVGFPVVFDLIEVVREHLTGSNLPSGQCVICLYGFTEGDAFTRTECFHYLHSFCLNRHINALRKNYNEEYDKLPAWLKKTIDPFQAVCPVCREPIKDETDNLKCAMPPSELQNAPEFILTKELRQLQERMCKLFLEQKSRGSIIDLEAESTTVISIETEDETRERLQRKQYEENQAASDTLEVKFLGSVSNERSDRASENSSPETTSGASGNAELKVNKTPLNVDFSPVVEATQARSVPDPTNNNYHHFRRHRGGRREHHRHYRQRYERERERNKDRDQNDIANNSTNSCTSLSSSNVNSGSKPKPNSHIGSHNR